MDIIDAGDGIFICTENHVAFVQASLRSWRLVLDHDHQYRSCRWQVMQKDQSPVDRACLSADAQKAALHAPVSQQLGDNPFSRLGRDGEADILRHSDDSCIDSYHLVERIYQRPAGIARVERRSMLDDILDQLTLPAA